MNKQINRQLEVCHIVLERALQGVNHMRQISNLPDSTIKQKNDPTNELFFESLVHSLTKTTAATSFLNDVKAGYHALDKTHAKKR